MNPATKQRCSGYRHKSPDPQAIAKYSTPGHDAMRGDFSGTCHRCRACEAARMRARRLPQTPPKTKPQAPEQSVAELIARMEFGEAPKKRGIRARLRERRVAEMIGRLERVTLPDVMP